MTGKEKAGARNFIHQRAPTYLNPSWISGWRWFHHCRYINMRIVALEGFINEDQIAVMYVGDQTMERRCAYNVC